MGSWACMTSCRQQTLIDAAHWLAMLEQQQGRHTATGEVHSDRRETTLCICVPTSGIEAHVVDRSDDASKLVL
eukprot:1139303-Pelagomonas_calceolata.AAC.3